MEKHVNLQDQSRNENGLATRSVNPFLEETQEKVPDDPIIEVDLRYKARTKATYLSGQIYLKRLQAEAHNFPWFFGYPVAPSEDIVFALSEKTVPAIRRVLIAFLGGRPIKSIAKRVPVSRSAVYKTLTWLYLVSDLRDWTLLGLVRVWDIPATKIEFGTLPPSYTIVPYSAPIVCLLCHRILQHVPLVDQREDYSVIETPRVDFEQDNVQTEHVRGHLIAHFPMFGRPRPNERRSISLYRPKDGSTARRSAHRWIDLLEEITVAAANGQRNQVRPLLPGRELTEIEVRKFYRDLMNEPSLAGGF
jgi:hypothetical protein